VIGSVFRDELGIRQTGDPHQGGQVNGKFMPSDGGLEKRRLVQESCFELGWRFCDNGSFML
jgi:hypothetical protein